ncbi:hypothetical protein NXS98_14155 [Fontisphaera persica]|uniref:hypothetical protein n=1 Tax=Fontisphaera persica TaxID=2974023 RepID=UPI0024C0DABC|nr:hypothetical protein [Fontisphaera persica]WCJ58851.1 hypothetical protein NXS98_14155 [Fontisphaera persica]
MNDEVFVARLVKGAVASSIASAILMPQGHTIWAEASLPTEAPTEAVPEVQAPFVEAYSHKDNPNTVHYSFRQMPKEWTKQMEREFRRLALLEAKGTLAGDQVSRLEELSLLRDRLFCPQPEEEILLQLKRDRLLEKISNTLREYVEFQEGAGKKRATA